MEMLVAVASKHGATDGIGGKIVDTLSEDGHTVSHVGPEDVGSVEPFDGVIIGSAVYAGHWMRPARELVARLAHELRETKVWLFSSGPIGEPPMPGEDPVDVADLVIATQARDHRMFAGELDRSRLGFAERAIARALHAPEGDFRDWHEISLWAKGISADV